MSAFQGLECKAVNGIQSVLEQNDGCPGLDTWSSTVDQKLVGKNHKIVLCIHVHSLTLQMLGG